MQRKPKNISIMITYIIVKASKRYHIYNAAGVCVNVVESLSAVHEYFDEVIAISHYTQIIQRFTESDCTTIVVLK